MSEISRQSMISDSEQDIQLERSTSEFSVSFGKPKKSLLKKVQSAVTIINEEEAMEFKTPDRDKPRRGLQWNIAQMTWTEELKQIREEIARRKLESPGVKSLVTIPRERFYHWQFSFDDMAYYPFGLDLSHMNVQNIEVINVLKHLSYLDLTDNDLKIDSLKILQDVNSIVALNLDQNKITSMNFPGSENIRWISLKNNTMTNLESFNMPLLEYAHLDNNQIKMIENFDSDSTPLLRLLSLKGNRVTSLRECNISPSLKYLYLGNNKLRSCEGIAHLSNLRVLHLRGNKIKKLKTISNELKNLYYLNLRDNLISNVRQFKKLRALSTLRVLITTGCPFEKESPKIVRLKVIYCLMHLKKLNKKEVMANEINESKKFREEIEAEEESSEDEPEEQEEDEDKSGAVGPRASQTVSSNPSSATMSSK